MLQTVNSNLYLIINLYIAKITVERVQNKHFNTIILDEAGCVNLLQVMDAVSTFSKKPRLPVLGGDHERLPAFKQSEEAKEHWPASFLRCCIDKKVKYKMLETSNIGHMIACSRRRTESYTRTESHQLSWLLTQGRFFAIS